MLIPYNFPQDGEYEIQVRLMRDRNEEVEGLHEPHELEVSARPRARGAVHGQAAAEGRKRSIGRREPEDARQSDGRPAQVGRRVSVAKSSSLLETTRQPLNVHFNFYRHPRLGPAVYQVSIVGPFDASGPGDTPSRRRIFISDPDGPDDEEECAKRILANLARRAYRRPVDDEDLQSPLEFYQRGHADGGFEAGIELALSVDARESAVPVSHRARSARNCDQRYAYRIERLELASRLSFFLWSSIPDDELLDLAARGELSQPDVLEQQVRRMLADERSRSLVTNFAGQWLYLRNLDSVIPDMRLFPDFDDNLRQALRQETELLLREHRARRPQRARSVQADYTFLNERLAKHYGIPHVYGSRFRRVAARRREPAAAACCARRAS